MSHIRGAAVLAWPQLRRGWRNLVGIALLIALVGGLALGGLAGADRTRSAVERMIAETESFDVKLNPTERMESALDFDDVASLPGVESAHQVFGLVVIPSDLSPTVDVFNEAPFALVSDGVALIEKGRPVLQAGRLPDPSVADEVYVNQTYADEHGIRAGDTLTWRFPSYDDFGRMSAITSDQELFDLYLDPTFAQEVNVTVAGTGSEIEAIAVDEGLEPVPIWTTPALFALLETPSPIFWGAGVYLEDPASVDEFRDDVDALVPDEVIVYETLDSLELKTSRAATPGAVALAIFAGVVAVLGLLLIAQAISRRLQLDARDNDVYAVIGATHWERFGSSMVRVAAAAGLGSLAAIGLAWASSWFTPVGPARGAEPDLGLALHPSMVWGAALLFTAVLAVATMPAWWSSRRLLPDRARRGSAIATWLGAMGASPSATTGVRFGLEPGRGSTAVPTRASIIGATTAVAITVTTVVFASSLDLVVADSLFYGSNYDDVVEVDSAELPITEEGRADLVDRILEDPSVEAASEQRVGEVEIGGTRVVAVAFSDGPSSVEPTIARGRAPIDVAEIALGSLTMDDLGIGVGDEVALAGARYAGPAVVVGQVVLPGIGYHRAADKTALGSGALVVPDVLGDPLAIADTAHVAVVVSDLDGRDPAEFRARVDEHIASFGVAVHSSVAQPADIRSLRGLRSLLLALVVALLVLVAATVVHTMVVALRRRRRDLAVLEAIGATSRDLRRVGAWQGCTVGGAALLFGVPFGVVVGRWSWIVLAERFGTIPKPVVSPLAMAAVVTAVVILASVIGIVPVQQGLRRRPGEVLRSE